MSVDPVEPTSGVRETRKPVKVEDNTQVTDPDKFKRILKVEESDESQQQKQRNQSKKLEEVEEEEATTKTTRPPPTPGAFGALLGTPADTTSIFDVQGGTTVSYTVSSAPEEAPSPMETYTPPSKGTDAARSPNIVPEVNAAYTEPVKVSAKQESASTSSDTKKESEPQQSLVKTKKATFKHKSAAPLPASTVKPTHIEHVETTAASPRMEQKAEAEHIEKETAQKKGEKEVEEMAPPLPLEIPKELQGGKKKEESPVTAVAPKEQTTSTEEVVVTAPQKKEEPHQRTQKDEKQKEFAVVEGAPPPLFTAPSLTISPTQSAAYAKLPSDTFELFRKMVGIMTVEQTKGVSKTTITLNMPGSVFDKCQVRLDHYDTAPHSFNLQLLATPQALDHFNANMSDLVAAFQQSRLSFEVNVQRPVLLSESKPSPKRKDERVSREKEEEEP